MSSRWPIVPVAEILTEYREYIDVPEARLYPKLSVKLYGRGVTLDTPSDGVTLRMKRHQIARCGQVILSEIWGKKGAIGIVPKEGDGALCTSHFFLFNVNTERMHPGWLQAIFRANYLARQLNAQAFGTTGYAAVRPQNLLAATIPLPPLPEQRRIVARIEEFAAKLEEARTLRQQAFAEAEALVNRTISTILDDDRWETSQLGEVLAEPPRNGLCPKPEAESAGRPMLRINAVSSSPNRFVNLAAYKTVEVADDEARPYVLQHEDVFIVRYNGDLNRVAKAGIFRGETNAVFPDKLMRLRPDREKMIPDFLVYALGSRRVRKQIEELGKTTAGQIGVSGTDAKSFIVPVPPLPEQHRVVFYLDSLQAKVDSLRLLQAQTAAELDALLPSILDKAFKGEL